jgi:SAM-dependent methyltransferase
MVIAVPVSLDFMPTLSRSMVGMSTNTTATESLLALLDRADSLPGAAELRSRTYDLLRLRVGELVVDVGCGAGRAVAELTERGATAIGVDFSEQMITAARKCWHDRSFLLGDAYDLPVGDGEAAGYRADKVFHELDDPAKALCEACRVLAPGGRVVLVGQDWDTIVIDSDDPELTRGIVHAGADTIASPRAARRYRALLLDAGFTDITIEVLTAVFTDTTMLPMLSGIADAASSAGAIPRERTDAWTAEQAARGRTGRLFVALPLFIAAAQRPGRDGGRNHYAQVPQRPPLTGERPVVNDATSALTSCSARRSTSTA